VDNTRPIFLMSIVFAVLFGVFFVPPMYFGGRRGAALGLVLVNATVLVSRTICIRQLKLRISLVQIAWRAIAAASAAGAVAMALGAAFADGRTAGALAVRVLVYLSLYLGGLAWLERDLLSDMIETFRLKPTRPVYDAPMVTSVP
jgi:O-antigen/teichoic acid export membrane protein